MSNSDLSAKTSIRVELDGDLAREFEDWRRRQDRIPSKAEGLRYLASRALSREHLVESMSA